jgi:hypothetical protein
MTISSSLMSRKIASFTGTKFICKTAVTQWYGNAPLMNSRPLNALWSEFDVPCLVRMTIDDKLPERHSPPTEQSFPGPSKRNEPSLWTIFVFQRHESKHRTFWPKVRTQGRVLVFHLSEWEMPRQTNAALYCSEGLLCIRVFGRVRTELNVKTHPCDLSGNLPQSVVNNVARVQSWVSYEVEKTSASKEKWPKVYGEKVSSCEE